MWRDRLEEYLLELQAHRCCHIRGRSPELVVVRDRLEEYPLNYKLTNTAKLEGDRLS